MTQAPAVSPADRAEDRYSTLDGLRGFSAVVIALHHYWPAAAQSAFFSLDLFFALSGFVLLRTYEARFRQGMSALDFVKRRAIRFLPLYWVGLAAGILLYITEVLRHMPRHMPPGMAAVALVPNLVMLPSLNTELLYPFNFPSWSLFCEFVVNVVMALWLWRLRTHSLVVLAIAFGIAMATLVIVHDGSITKVLNGLPRSGFNAGAGREGWYIGLARATYSFLVGMVIARLERPRKRKRSWIACLAWVMLLVLQSLPIPLGYRLDFDLGSGLLMPPVLLMIGTRFDSPIALEDLALWFGDISFGLYMVHIALTRTFGIIHVRLHLAMPTLAPAYLACSVLLGWLATKWVDVPIRHWLSARLLPRRRPQLKREPAESR